MYPLMDKGDLGKAMPGFNQQQRTVVLWQLARALEFLHMNISGVRLAALFLKETFR